MYGAVVAQVLALVFSIVDCLCKASMKSDATFKVKNIHTLHLRARVERATLERPLAVGTRNTIAFHE